MPTTTPGAADELRALASRPRYKVTPKMVVEARLAAGLTQKECAAVMICGERTLQQWEEGRSEMSQRDYEFLLLLTRSPEARAALRKVHKPRR